MPEPKYEIKKPKHVLKEIWFHFLYGLACNPEIHILYGLACNPEIHILYGLACNPEIHILYGLACNPEIHILYGLAYNPEIHILYGQACNPEIHILYGLACNPEELWSITSDFPKANLRPRAKGLPEENHLWGFTTPVGVVWVSKEPSVGTV